MSDEEDDARVYGMPDPTNRQLPGEEGLRGEQGAQQEGRPDLTHIERLPDGHTVELEESSGAAFAEVTGKAADTHGPDEASDVDERP